MSIPFLLFVLTIIILGGSIYLYLSKEQKKALAPKDKYDEAWIEFYKNEQPSRHIQKYLSLSNLFLGTVSVFLFVIFLNFTIYLITFNDSSNKEPHLSESVASLPISIPIFCLSITLISIFLLSVSGKNLHSLRWIRDFRVENGSV